MGSVQSAENRISRRALLRGTAGRLAAAPSLEPGLEHCRAQGLSPPLPSESHPARTDVGRLLTRHFRR